MADGCASSKKTRRKTRKNAKEKSWIEASAIDEDVSDALQTNPSTTETLEETLFGYNVGSDEKSQTLAALKLEVLGPFLFSYTSLCDKAVQLARNKELLSSDSLVWPMFFDKAWWSHITVLSHVITSFTGLCEKDHAVYQSILSGMDMANASIIKNLRNHCPGDRLKTVPDDQINIFYNLIQTQGADYGVRARENKDLASHFLRSLTDKIKLADRVKNRGNSNFKQLRFCAAIADYSTAIKLCPFNPVLYCNRALCYRHNNDCWNACIDSYRALVLHPTWDKPYYRCAEAWHKLGDITCAIDVNQYGQFVCTSSTDLITQLKNFTAPDKVRDKAANSKDSLREDSRKLSREKIAKDKVASGQDKTGVTSTVKGQGLPLNEFTDLHCPEVDPRISCLELRKLCNQVKLQWCSPASYLSGPGHHSWEDLEPEWVEPTPPITSILAPRDPMMAKFDEIWCPVLADVQESLTIIPPTFQYFNDGTIMHSEVF